MAVRVVDLTQPLGPETVLWPGLGRIEVETTSEIAADGFYGRRLTLPEHSGTHLDAPAHFAPEGARADEIPASRLVAPCAVLDVRAACRADPDLGLGRLEVEEAERRDGPIEAGSAVLVWTGWEDLVADPARYLGDAGDSGLHFPGVAAAGAEALVERGIVGLGVDTANVDRGCDGAFPVHHTTLPAGLWHLEGLVNLGALPARGALLVVGALKLRGGSGAPARVFALV